MRVLLISDFGLHHTPGGAQRSNQIIVDEGRRRGHHIDLFHYDSEPVIKDNYDIIISSNLEVISRVYPELLGCIMRSGRHVRLEHDSNTYWTNDFRKQFWGTCNVSFFLTKYHHDFFVDLYGDIFPNVRIVPDPIDRSFTNLRLDRSGTGYVGFMHYLKGTGNFIEYVKQNPQKQFHVAGWGDESYINELNKFKNVRMLGKVEYSLMPIFYNTIQELYYNPVCKEPFCRAVGEALICGTNLICNNQIGAVHEYNLNPSIFTDRCYNAASLFWKELE